MPGKAIPRLLKRLTVEEHWGESFPRSLHYTENGQHYLLTFPDLKVFEREFGTRVIQ